MAKMCLKQDFLLFHFVLLNKIIPLHTKAFVERTFLRFIRYHVFVEILISRCKAYSHKFISVGTSRECNRRF